MSESTARAAIKAVLDGVSNIGQVHDYQRFSRNLSDYFDQFKTTISSANVIRGWTVALQSADTEYVSPPGDNDYLVRRNYTYKVRGYIGHNDADATEKTAAALVETVLNALDSDTTLHNEQAFFGQLISAQLDVFELREFGNYLVHYAEITQQVIDVANAGG